MSEGIGARLKVTSLSESMSSYLTRVACDF